MLDAVGRVVYRTLLRSAHEFDKHSALKALILREHVDQLPAELQTVAAAFMGGRDRHYVWPSLALPQSLAEAVRWGFRFPPEEPSIDAAFVAIRYLQSLTSLGRKHKLTGQPVLDGLPGQPEQGLQILSVPEPGVMLIPHPMLNGWFANNPVLLLQHCPMQGSVGVCLSKPFPGGGRVLAKLSELAPHLEPEPPNPHYRTLLSVRRGLRIDPEFSPVIDKLFSDSEDESDDDASMYPGEQSSEAPAADQAEALRVILRAPKPGLGGWDSDEDDRQDEDDVLQASVMVAVMPMPSPWGSQAGAGHEDEDSIFRRRPPHSLPRPDSPHALASPASRQWHSSSRSGGPPPSQCGLQSSCSEAASSSAADKCESDQQPARPRSPTPLGRQRLGSRRLRSTMHRTSRGNAWHPLAQAPAFGRHRAGDLSAGLRQTAEFWAGFKAGRRAAKRLRGGSREGKSSRQPGWLSQIIQTARKQLGLTAASGPAPLTVGTSPSMDIARSEAERGKPEQQQEPAQQLSHEQGASGAAGADQIITGGSSSSTPSSPPSPDSADARPRSQAVELAAFESSSVSLGGPCHGFQLLHSSEELHAASGQRAVQVSPPSSAHTAVYAGGDPEYGRQMLADGRLEPSQVHVFMGEALWEGGQLEAELANGCWILARPPPDLLQLIAPGPEPAVHGSGETVLKLWQGMMAALPPEHAKLAHISPDLRRDLRDLKI